MTQEEIIEGNKIIAEYKTQQRFMNHSIYIDSELFFDNQLKYHKSWNWLKPIIDNIVQQIGVKTIDDCDDEEWFITINITRMSISVSIEYAWKRVIEFIKWYNKQQL